MHKHLIEKTLTNYFPNKHIALTSSGTSSLITILHTLKKIYKDKDEVILPSVVCPSLLTVVNSLSLKPVFVDMEMKYFNMDFNHIRKLINHKTISIICVHCYGIAANIEKINKFAKRKKIFLIEDICLNFGGKLRDKYFGSYGDASIISFGVDKILNIGGGALVIKKKSIYNKSKKFLLKNSFFSDINFNKKKIKEKINSLSKNIIDRNLNAKYLFENILSKSFIKPKYRKNDVYWRYPMISKINREKLIHDAKKKGIVITSHYPSINRFQYNSNLKNAEIFNKSVINIFVKKQKTKNYLKKVCNFLNKI